MFRFDHDVNLQGAGSLAFITASEPQVCAITSIEHVAAPTISWACISGLCSEVVTRHENQMGVWTKRS